MRSSIEVLHRAAWRSLVSMVLLSPVTPAAAQAPSFNPRVLSPFQRLKVEQLLRTRYPCIGCHEIAGTGGHLAPPLSQLNARRSPGYVYAMIRDPQGTVPGTIMPKVPMDDRTLELIASYLAGTGGGPEPAVATPLVTPAQIAGDSGALYGRFCAGCHGTTGRGDGPNASSLPVPPTAHASRPAMSARSDDALFDTIYAGGFIMNRSHTMPPFGETLTRSQIRGLVRYIRSLCRCEGPGWSRDGTR